MRIYSMNILSVSQATKDIKVKVFISCWKVSWFFFSFTLSSSTFCLTNIFLGILKCFATYGCCHPCFKNKDTYGWFYIFFYHISPLDANGATTSRIKSENRRGHFVNILKLNQSNVTSSGCKIDFTVHLKFTEKETKTKMTIS